MSLTRKILFLVAGVVALLLLLNLTVLPYVTQRYFYDFLQKFYIETRQNELDSEILSIINQYPDQAAEMLEKYRELDADLGNLISGFEKFVTSDPVFDRETVGKYLEDSGVEENQVENIIGLNAMSAFLKNSPLGFSFTGENDPKRQFVSQVLVAMVSINLLFVLVVGACVLYFLRRSFYPIKSVTETLDNFTTGGGRMLEYDGRDEFRPLVDSLNNLRIRVDHQEKIRRQFLADMSHELKTPMTAIRVYLEGIKDGVIQLNPKNIEALTGELARLTKIVESLMHFQTFESRPTQFRHEKVQVADIFGVVYETHSQELLPQDQSMIYVGPKKATIFFDPDSLVQIFHNIVANFIRYAGAHTQLRVNFLHEKTTDIFIFQDNGGGVSASDLPYLKEKFYQADKVKTGNAEDRGIGIGLSIIDKIVRDAGGNVDLISAEGEGFTVRIEIPHQHV